MPKRRVRPAAAARAPHAVEALGDHRRRLAPREVDVDVLGRDGLGRRRRAAEVDVGDRVGHRARGRALDLVEAAGEVERCARPRAADHLEELRGLRVARVLVVVDAERGPARRARRR